ncbi:hypothetical protein GCM10011495_06790 [Hymenobacter frigidus]|uniref:DUF3078 domain-containing protein n=1 Tax=Hymenobacter frigidus TaxID=1524095 RepID=A0ABQ1ZZM7_9BACT|nr:hypothetical protein [Hymenobacter frigidus]GGH80891.1 hypothetical protein GCM10011495_06790 [Hymenobacter frigidus]
MKLPLLLIPLFLSATVCIGQVKPTTEKKKAKVEKKKAEAAAKAADPSTPVTGVVTPKNFTKIFNNDVTYLLTGDKTVNSFGSFVSLNVIKPSATLSTSGVIRRPGGRVSTIGTLSLTGAVGEDIVSVFSDNKFNSSFEGKLNISQLIPPSRFSRFFYYGSTREKLNKDTEAATDYFILQRNTLILERLALESTIATLTTLSATDEVKAKLDIARYKLKRLQQQSLPAIAKAEADSISKLELKVQWSSKRISWFDIFVAVKGQKFSTYDSLALFPEKVKEVQFTGYQVGIALNLVSAAPKVTWGGGYYRLELSSSNETNLASLKTIEVSQSQQFKSGNKSVQSSDKASAYFRDKYANSHYINFRANYFKQIAPDQKAYLRLGYEYSNPYSTPDEYKSKIQTTHNLVLGLLVAATNKDKDQAKTKPVLNIQPFIRFIDLGNAYKLEGSMFRRSEIGILTTFPLGLGITTP